MPHEITVAELALQLWVEWFRKGGDPLHASEVDGDLSCFFCGGYALDRDSQEHDPECIWLRAKQLVKNPAYAKLP